MKAKIIGEDDRGLGVEVTDNNSNNHTISVGFDGEIQGHSQDGYPDDPRERPLEESECINQAQRFARYHVYRERGYETLTPWQNPDCILATALVLASVNQATIETRFGDLYQQVRSHTTVEEPPVSLPKSVVSNNVTYYKDVYLGLSDDSVLSVENNSGTESAALLKQSLEDDTPLAEVDLSETPLADLDIADLIQATSGVHLYWDDASGEYHTQRTADPDIEREPDGRIELLPFEPTSLGEFRLQMVRNLYCQIRDRYVGMGVRPPEQFCLQGMGVYEYSTWYDTYDFYQRYHDPSADIDWDRLGELPTSE